MMDFAELTKRLDRDLYDSCDGASLQKLGRSLDRSKGFSALLQNRDAVLAPFPAASLQGLSEIYEEYKRWKQAFKDTRRAMAQSKIMVPDICLKQVATPDEFSALMRTARMCPRSGYPDVNSWANAVQAHVDLWTACVELTANNGKVTIEISAPDHPDAEQFEGSIVNAAAISEIRGYKWLAAARGERAGALKISLQLPSDDIESQAGARMSKMGLAAQKRELASLLDELIYQDLEGTVKSNLGRRSQIEAIRTASQAYVGLVTTPPLQTAALLSVYVASTTAPVGLVVLDKAGSVLADRVVPVGQDLGAAIAQMLAEHGVDSAVLPVSNGDQDRLSVAETALGDVPITRVLSAAMREAREKHSFEPMIAGAVVLGHRAIMPSTAWGQIEPSSLGLGEYSSDLDEDHLGRVMKEAKLIARYESGREGVAGVPLGKGQAMRRRKLNPLLKTIRDLKPGMTVDGVVTNLTRFGAFVNIGLSTEAMIHVSQLSTEFVDEPSQVVRVGQQLSARVLEVVPEKSRIALSLKPVEFEGGRGDGKQPAVSSAAARAASAMFEEMKQGTKTEKSRPTGVPLESMESSRRSRSRGPDGTGPRGGGNRPEDKKNRSEALADLDALFKK